MLNKENMGKVAKKWHNSLKRGGYEYHANKRKVKKLKNFSRFWKVILKKMDLSLSHETRVFEMGCGGAYHLVQFALNNCECVGLDCSKEVLEKAENFVKELEKTSNKKLNTKFIWADILNYTLPKQKFDLVFQVGVVEHFLDSKERRLVIEKMFGLAKRGGYIVSAVPNGIHPLRKKMRKCKLGGYSIPEIDYTPSLLYKELEEYGKVIEILPYNLFVYLIFDYSNIFSYYIKKSAYYFFQILPQNLLSLQTRYKHCGLLVGIAKKI